MWWKKEPPKEIVEWAREICNKKGAPQEEIFKLLTAKGWTLERGSYRMGPLGQQEDMEFAQQGSGWRITLSLTFRNQLLEGGEVTYYPRKPRL